MTLHQFAERSRARITKDRADDTDIIRGKHGQVYEHSEGLLGVMFMPAPTADQPWGEWKPRTWGNFKRAGTSAGMTVLQDGDSEGCMGFDPVSAKQANLALRIAGVKRKRKMTPEHRLRQQEILANARLLRRKLYQVGPSTV